MDRICATIVTSRTKACIVGDAVLSIVDVVDHIVVVDLQTGDDNTIDVIRDKAGHIGVSVVPYAGVGAMAEWRNAGIDAAIGLGYDWVMILDTDERFICNGVDIRKVLSSVREPIEWVAVSCDDGSYNKMRFIRSSSKARFAQSCGVHEVLEPEVRFGSLQRVRFSELPKSRVALRRRVRGDINGLRAQVRLHPESCRWMMYLACSLEYMGKIRAAEKCFRQSIDLATTGNEYAWLCFCVARTMDAQHRHAESLAMLCAGMTAEPSMPELTWYAAVQCHRMGRFKDAILWAKIALLNNWVDHLDDTRSGHRDIIAMFDGPWDVIGASYKDMGDLRMSEIAYTKKAKAEKARLAYMRGF